jgi:lysine biosynthesis protein LysW
MWDIIDALSRSRLPGGFWHVTHPLAKPNVDAHAEERMATCPECDAEIEVDEFDVDKGDQLSCPECGSNLEVASLSPVELDIASEDDDDDDDDEDEDDDGDDDEDEDEEDDEEDDDGGGWEA